MLTKFFPCNFKMAQTEQATQDMNKSWDDRVAESKKDIKVNLSLGIIHQMFFRAHDWSKHIT